MVRAEVEPGHNANAELVQVQDCLDLRASHTISSPTVGAEPGLSFRGLGATLGIGLMTLMFFVPAALLSEALMRRGDAADCSDTVR
jgi:hypothetical protein